ncbi:MAG: hypothetical protein R3E13_00885 [Alphaproteobacteria bacterium]
MNKSKLQCALLCPPVQNPFNLLSFNNTKDGKRVPAVITIGHFRSKGSEQTLTADVAETIAFNGSMAQITGEEGGPAQDPRVQACTAALSFLDPER